MNRSTWNAKTQSILASTCLLIGASAVTHGQLMTLSACGGQTNPACGVLDPAFYANYDYQGQTLPMDCDYGLPTRPKTGPIARTSTSASSSTPIRRSSGSRFWPSNTVSARTHPSIGSTLWECIIRSAIPTKGARIRLVRDRLCHNGVGNDTDSLLYPQYQDGRLYLFAIKEIAHWLEQNPGEVIILCINNSLADDGGFADLLNKPLQTYLGSKILSVNDYNNYNNGKFWPTLRELRSRGKQTIIFGSNPTDLIFNFDSFFPSQAQPATDNLAYCRDPNGNDVRLRAFNAFAYIAEDRSKSATEPYSTPTGDLVSSLFAWRSASPRRAGSPYALSSSVFACSASARASGAFLPA